MRIHTHLLLAAALPMLACIAYKPEPENGKQSCASTGTKKCPDNYVCGPDNKCYKEGSGGSTGTSAGGAMGGKTTTSPSNTNTIECAPSGGTCAKSGVAIQICCSATACKYTAGTLEYACSATDCSSAYQSIANACTPVTTGGAKGGVVGGGVGGAAGWSAGAVAGAVGGSGGVSSGGARSSSSMGGSIGGVTTVGGMNCADASVTCALSGGPISACCSATDCKFVAAGRDFPCVGTNCDAAAQAVVDYCTLGGTGGIPASGGAGGSIVPVGGSTSRVGGTIATVPVGGTVRVGGSTSALAGAGGTAITSSPSSGLVTFRSGAAVGAMTGYAWIALAPLDIVTSPTCGVDAIPLSADQPCTTSLNWNSQNALCLSGIIPALPVSPTTLDYNNNWGIQIGVNPQVDPTGTLGRAYSSISASVSGAPAAGFRLELHRKGDPDTVSYCYDVFSGQTVSLNLFNTQCWGNATTVYLQSTDVPNIDHVGIQINSTQSTITLSNLCLNSISFGP